VRRAVIAMVLSFCLILGAAGAFANNFLVINTNDSGDGSLRQAIFNANGNPGADTISFIFSGPAVHTITITSALPVVTDPLIIDATLPGFTGIPLIELTTSSTASLSGLEVQTTNCTIRGLIINRFWTGIDVVHGSANTIQGNWIGLASDGVTVAANNTGIALGSGSSNNRIGGTAAADRNVISGNEVGVDISGRSLVQYVNLNDVSNVIEGNFIGTDKTGTVAAPNGTGILLNQKAEGTLIGGLNNGGGPGGFGNGVGAASRNIISGNKYHGVQTWSAVGRSMIQYNWIGLDVNGASLPNATLLTTDGSGQNGIFAGGPTTVAYNKIANNFGEGVRVFNQSVDFDANSIFSNQRLGIGFSSSGTPAPNDAGDTALPQNYPVITSAISESTQVKINGTLNSAANSPFQLEFFSNTSCDPSGNGEGQTWLGGAAVFTDVNGNATFNVTLPTFVPAGAFITSTARDAGLNGSEFSACRQVVAAAPPSVTSISPTSGPFGSTVTINGSGFTTVYGVFFLGDGSAGNDVPAQFQIVSDTKITTTVPNGGISSGPIRILSNYGETSTGTFTINNPAPTLTSITPNSGPGAGGTSVTIHGTGFLPGATVLIANAPPANVVITNSTTITAQTTPHIAESVDVFVGNTDGKGAYLFGGFTYFCSPDLSATITAPRSVPPGSTNNQASVPDAGPNATYTWNLYVGTITSGAGTRTITFSVGSSDVVIYVTVTRPDCSAASHRPVRVAGTRGDSDNDGKSDITMQNLSTRDVAVWQMNGASIKSGILVGAPAPSYFVKTVGDFNGDGKADIALQDSATGNVAVWLMNGGTILSGAVVGNPGAGWQVVGSGDVDGNRKADLVLQNSTTGDVAVWLMDGAAIQGGAVVGSPGTAFRVVGVADFSGDFLADILLQNTAGDIAEWQMSGLTIVNAAIVGTPGTSWVVKGVGDVNNDGVADILLRNSGTGDIAEWQMNGLTIVAGFNMGGPGTGFDLMGSADFNGDGYSDVLLRDSAGNLAVWLLQGATITSGAVAGSPGVNYVPILN
jgi:IPT/TIG domain/FG-GAP-like repeat/PKD-like domain